MVDYNCLVPNVSRVFPSVSLYNGGNCFIKWKRFCPHNEPTVMISVISFHASSQPRGNHISYFLHSFFTPCTSLCSQPGLLQLQHKQYVHVCPVDVDLTQRNEEQNLCKGQHSKITQTAIFNASKYFSSSVLMLSKIADMTHCSMKY